MKAIATLLYTQSYLPGVLVLARTLRQLGVPEGTRLVVILSCGLTEYERGLLDDAYDTVIEAGVISGGDTPQLKLLGRPELRSSFSKLGVWSLTQFETVVYLDADVLPMKPLDELLALDLKSTQIGASPDCGWPDIFNSGVLVLKPDLDVYEELVQKSQDPSGSFDGADQGLLNEYFNVGKPQGWVRLPFVYNVTPTGQYQYQPALKFFLNDIKCFHFIGATKPWQDPAWTGDELKEKWWLQFEEFYGPERDIAKVIHGIVPRYYEPEIEECAEVLEATELEENVFVAQSPLLDPADVEDEVQEILLDPQSYDVFETVEPTEQPWNPFIEEPPKDGKPEAINFPQNLHYGNTWDNEKVVEPESVQEEPDIPDEPETEVEEAGTKPPPIFPWEFEDRQYEPERVFDQSFGTFGFDGMPLIQRIKRTQAMLAEQREEEGEDEKEEELIEEALEAEEEE